QRLSAISSLPSWRRSASSFSVQPSTAAMTGVVIRTPTGMTTTSAMTIRTAPSMGPSSPDPRPRLHFDQRAERQLGHADGRAGRPVVAEDLRVDLVHHRVVAHVAQEDGGLHHVAERGALGGQL